MAKLPRVIDPTLHLPRPPFWLVAGLMTLVVLSWVPLALIARARVTLSPKRAVHIFQDMDKQAKYTAQGVNPLFADGRAMRPPVPGTVARGELELDDHYDRGYELVQGADGQWQVEYFRGFPEQVEVNEALVTRGREQFNIYCAPCHGLDGSGQGAVHARVLRSQAADTVWVPPVDLHAKMPDGRLVYGEGLYPEGKLFNVITNGIRNMPGYAAQIDVPDRWAIVAYIRALQWSQDPPAQQPATQAAAQR
ncbi:MAG TPA: cytochrome c [Phycisphaeraceae bacterium]